MQIHHIGYLVKKIDRAIFAFEQLGWVIECNTVYDAYRAIDICFMIKDGYRVELVSPKRKDSVVYELQKKCGNSPYHICYMCDNLAEKCEELCGRGYVKYAEPREAVAFSNKRVCFLIHPYLGMIELLEE